MKARDGRCGNRWGAHLIVVAAIAAGTFLWSGCGDNPVAPGSNDDRLTGTTHGDVKSEPDVRGGEVTADDGRKTIRTNPRYVTAVLSPGGGVIEIPTGRHRSTLSVLSGAVDSPVRITAQASEQAGTRGFHALYDFQPDDLELDRPAELTYFGDLPDGRSVALFRWNAESRSWVVVQTMPVFDGAVTFWIQSFSKYGIGVNEDNDSGTAD